MDLTKSEEGLLSGKHDQVAWMKGCDLSSLRNFVHGKGFRVRPVRNDSLKANFVALRNDFLRQGCGEITIAFHGTKVHHIPSIEAKGLLVSCFLFLDVLLLAFEEKGQVPDGKVVKHVSDSGWWV